MVTLAINWQNFTQIRLQLKSSFRIRPFDRQICEYQQRLDTLATLCGDEIFLTTSSPARPLRFSRRNWPFPVLSAVNCPDFAATVTAFFCPLTYAGSPPP